MSTGWASGAARTSSRSIAAGRLLRGDAQVVERERGDLLERRGGDLAAVDLAAAGLVDHDGHEQLGAIGGREADERGDVAGVRVQAGGLVDLVRRAGLAGELVAGDLRLARRAARREDALEHDAQRLARLGRDDAAALRDLRRAAVDGLHDPRRLEDPAVGDRGVRARHLHRRDADALADRQVAHRRAGVLLQREHLTDLLAGQVDAGRLAEAEAADPLVEAPRADLHADLDRADVARLGEDLARRERHVAARVRLADRPV